MALSPQPVELDPVTLAGKVTHDNFEKSKPEWSVYAAKHGTANLDKSKWDFNESNTAGETRDATLTLASDAADQIALLHEGKQIALYVKYPENQFIDTVNVRLKKT